MKCITVLCFLFFACAQDQEFKGEINSGIEQDSLITFEIETDSVLISETYKLPVENWFKLKDNRDSLSFVRKNNFLQKISIFSKYENNPSFNLENFFEKPNWKKITYFDNVTDDRERVEIMVDNRLYFSADYAPDGSIENEESYYLIDILRESKNETCINIEQPGYELVDYEYEFLVSLSNDSLNISPTKNICADKKIGFGKICGSFPVTQDSIFIKCKLIKTISRNLVGDLEEILQTNTEFSYWTKIPDVNTKRMLRDKSAKKR